MSSIKDRVKGFVERYVDLAMDAAGEAEFRDDIPGDIPQRIQYIVNEKILLKDAPKVKQYVNAPARKIFTKNKGLGNVVFSRGDTAGKRMVDAAFTQPGVQTGMKIDMKLKPQYTMDQIRESYRNSLNLGSLHGRGIGGTIGLEDGRKMVYINREALRNPAVQKAFGVKGFRDAQRNVLRHEAFHNIPVIGQSEILAHIAGGTAVGGNIFNRVKAIEGGVGAKAKYLAKGLGAKGKSMGRSYLNLWMARPDRALLEHAILGAGIYGGVKAGKAIKGSIDKRKKKQTASSVDKVAMKLASLAANSNK